MDNVYIIKSVRGLALKMPICKSKRDHSAHIRMRNGRVLATTDKLVVKKRTYLYNNQQLLQLTIDLRRNVSV